MAEQHGYEKADLNVRGIVAGGAVIIAGIALAAAGAWLTLRWNDMDPGGPNMPATVQVDGPPLQSNAIADRNAFFHDKEQQLSSPASGEGPGRPAHIPIDRAMRELVQEQQEQRR